MSPAHYPEGKLGKTKLLSGQNTLFNHLKPTPSGKEC